MKRLLFFIFISILSCSSSHAEDPQERYYDLSNASIRLPEKSVAELPSAILNTGKAYIVTDGNSSGDCTVGGGTTSSICRSNGESWVSVGGGGSVSGLNAGYISKSLTSSSISDSSIYDLNSNIGFNTTTPSYVVHSKEPGYFDLVYTYNASTYTDVTTESKTTFGTAFGGFANLNTYYLYVGKSTTFDDVFFTVKTATTASNTLNAEYWNGSSWTALTITDGTNNYQNSGHVTYSVPGAWAQVAVNSQTYYWLRFYLTSSPTTQPSLYAVRPGSAGPIAGYSSYSDTVPVFQVTGAGNVLSANVAGAIKSIATPVSYVVGLTSSSNGNRVDFQCVGAKDQVCIQKAITACAGSPCKITVLEGTYNLTSYIGPLQSNLELEGVGAKLVISNTPVSIIQDNGTTGSAGTPLHDITIHGFEFDRSADTKDANVARKAIFIQYVERLHIYNNYAHDTGGTCFGVDWLVGSYIHHNLLENCGTSTATTGSSGIGIGTSEYVSEPNVLADNVIIGAGYGGILVETQGGHTAGESNNFVISDNILIGGYQYGIVVDHASHGTITGNVIRSNTKDGIIIKGTDPNDWTIVGNDITSNTLYGLRVSSTGASNIHVADNNMTQNGTAAILNSITSSLELTRFNNLGDTESFLENSFRIIAPAAQTIAAGNVVAADACGTVKAITSAGAVTTDTTNTFTAPAAGNNGCCMDVINVGANNITLDQNADFISFGGADVVLTANDAVRVCQYNNAAWYQTGLLVAN